MKKPDLQFQDIIKEFDAQLTDVKNDRKKIRKYFLLNQEKIDFFIDSIINEKLFHEEKLITIIQRIFDLLKMAFFFKLRYFIN